MARANFTHTIENHNGEDVIVIEDLNIGGTSVTNDIENVLYDISIMEKIEPANYMVVYRDSQGSWDGWDHGRQTFVALDEQSWKWAVNKFAHLRKSQILT